MRGWQIEIYEGHCQNFLRQDIKKQEKQKKEAKGQRSWWSKHFIS